jgi:hypothetical protein
MALAIPMEEELLEPFYTWRDHFDFQEVEHLHVIHVVKKNITPLEFGLMESPDERTFKEMAPTLKKFLQDEVKKSSRIILEEKSPISYPAVFTRKKTWLITLKK